MTAPAPTEHRPREPLDRPEQRTAAPEAALREVTSHADPLAVTPAAHAAETAVAPWPSREPDARPTERHEVGAEAWLRATAGLVALGRMAAGLAHDLNNLLGVIAGHADLLCEAIPPDHPQHETAAVIAETAHAAAGMTRQLLALGRPAAPAAGPLDASAAVRALEPTLRQLIGKGVPFELHPAAGLPLIRADAGEFDRVVINLVLNARDALGTGDRGTVTVSTSLAAVEPGRGGRPPDRTPGECVVVAVADTGCGMTPEVRERMFDLFFTTKGDRGTGLGLATVKDVATAAGGHVEVESEVGRGTTVRVYWPALTDPPPSSQRESE